MKKEKAAMGNLGRTPTPLKKAKPVTEVKQSRTITFPEGRPMTFPEAMKVVITGGKITKKEWDNPEIYGFLNDEFLSLHKDDGKNYKWLVNDGDLMGDDWVEL